MLKFLLNRYSAIAAITLTLLTACGGGGGDSGVTPPSNTVLSLEVQGTGSVVSQPAGLNCTAICRAEFALNTVVTLTATPGTGQTFVGWTGACNGAANTCVITMDPVRIASVPDVTAKFAPSAGQTTYTFNLTIAGSGSVVSQPAGISCSASCNADFSANTVLTLTATPAANQSFTGWTGACAGAASSCTVTMNQARTVGATFQPVVGTNFALTVSVSGSGSVVSNPAGISCGTACSANFAAGTTVTLTATPAAGQVFSSWGGACSGTQPGCTLQLTQVRAAQAVFAAAPVASTFQPPQLLETNNDFNVADENQFTDADMLVAVNRNGDAMAIWEQSDGVPNGRTLKIFSRRYQAATGWQAAVVVPGLAPTSFSTDVVSGSLLMDDAGVVTWIRPDLETRRNSPSTGWSAAFSPPNLRFSQNLTSAVMDANGNIGVLRSGSDIEHNALPAGGTWGTWTLLDNGGSAVSQRAQLALSSNGTALAVWRESNPGDSNYSMKAARYTPAGGWSAPESIETLVTNVTSANPAVTIDAQGNGIAMWQQGGNNTLHYNIYRTGSGWQGAVEVGGQSNGLGSASIQLAMTPDGRALAVWSGGGAFSNLNSMQYNPATGWTTPVIVDEYNVNRRMQMDNSGQAVMVYSPRFVAPSTNFDLVSRSLTLGGQWSAPTLIETGAGSLRDPFFAMNQAGQGVVIWTQNDVANSAVRNSLWSSVLR
jgi:Divergent InlB B-repeat domain